ncbi:GTPase [Pseudomonas alliivorans]|uniref:50S ribosome-binding GTPase n=1 Tax=Pseudomonas alliivorans TaxID=2810613 RepID=A0ABS4C354_9PSED|nr:GTPase [Pseudomonas alliivorans]MBP0945005.1 50S ribosome-binding GTPase [Pseudomonas alliivorans]MEE4324547.1 GTPase [Pseudomonas alliivorans]MEE4366077.1 GTPase [Pseudomonas alliivorans]
MSKPNEAPEDVLSKATADSVAKSQDEVSKLSRRVASVLAQTSKTADFALSQRVPDAEGDVAQTLANILNEKRGSILNLVERQRNALSTFNIVLFGLTGAGKSSLITAFTRGNGSIVSQGESDWTTDVQPLAWNACLIYDTPGINGWGRNNSRKDLEARARKAVEVADFVLVCFDSQSQQADEFAKFAAWVSEYRKPAIAVLNPRNAMWRMPSRVSAPMARGNLSRAVSEHATNIRDELSRLGVNDVPVVAVSSMRAVFARASMPFEGPDLESLTKQRDMYSCDSLEQWSNYPRLEDLLVSVITDAAVDIRLGCLNDQLRGAFMLSTKSGVSLLWVPSH